MGWFSEFYTSLLYVSNIGTNSFAEYQFDASNSEEDKYFNKRKSTYGVHYEIREDQNSRGSGQ